MSNDKDYEGYYAYAYLKVQKLDSASWVLLNVVFGAECDGACQIWTYAVRTYIPVKFKILLLILNYHL